MTRALFLRIPLTSKLATESVDEVICCDDPKMTGSSHTRCSRCSFHDRLTVEKEMCLRRRGNRRSVDRGNLLASLCLDVGNHLAQPHLFLPVPRARTMFLERLMRRTVAASVTSHSFRYRPPIGPDTIVPPPATVKNSLPGLQEPSWKMLKY